MGKASYIKQINPITSGNFKTPGNSASINYSDLPPAFSFSCVQEDYCLSKWKPDRIKGLISTLSELEQLKWSEIIGKHFKSYNSVDKKGLKPSLPNYVTPDTTISYFQPFGSRSPYRVFGIRERHNFKFLWFDKTHSVYPGQHR